MLKLTARFHQYSQDVTYQPALDQSRYALHMKRQSIIDEIDQFQIGADFFKSGKFKRVHQLYNFYATRTAAAMFERLPKQFIHGDNHQFNLVLRNGEAFYIDLDARRYDVRLYDFSSMIRHGSEQVNQDYLALTRKGQLFATIDQHYGELTSDEKNSFHLILAFSYIEFFSWALCRMKYNLANNEGEAAEHLLALIVDKSDQLLQLMAEGFIEEAQLQNATSKLKGNFATLLFNPAQQTASSASLGSHLFNPQVKRT